MTHWQETPLTEHEILDRLSSHIDQYCRHELARCLDEIDARHQGQLRTLAKTGRLAQGVLIINMLVILIHVAGWIFG